MLRLCRAIRDVSGGATIVDSTKHPSSAYVLARVPGLDLSIVHLVRDSRGVAYSWTKEIRKPEVTDADAYLDMYHPARIAGRWMAYNGLLHALRTGSSIRSVFLRYEDLIQDPQLSVAKIAHVAGTRLPREEVKGVGSNWVEVGSSHTIAGNPVRFAGSPLHLRVDAAWRTDMRTQDRLLVTGLTWPLLSAYGYVGRPRGVRTTPPRPPERDTST
jgi:hypothetical protein